MDPSPTELIAFATVTDVADWAGVSNAPGPMVGTPGAASPSVRHSLFAFLGLAGTEHWRVIAAYNEADFGTVLVNWQILAAAPNAVQRATAGLFGRACRIAGGTQQTQAAVAAAAAAVVTVATATTAAGSKVKLSAVADQTSEIEIDRVDEAFIDAGFAEYDRRLGGVPPPDHEPTADQLSAVWYLVSARLPPYVDFGVFGPHAVRMQRKLRLAGLVMSPSGELIRSELQGPPTFALWDACWTVFGVCMIMLKAAAPAALDAYRNHISSAYQRYGEGCWALIYQCDTRARREMAERIRRKGAAMHTKAVAAGAAAVAACEFDPMLPWDYVFRSLPSEFEFWQRELTEPAILIATGGNNPRSFLSGEAPIAAGSAGHIAEQEDQYHGGRGGRSDSGGYGGGRVRQSPKAKNRGNKERHHTVADGKYSANRSGVGLCDGFQAGTCSSTSCAYKHQCNKCLASDHGSAWGTGCTKVPSAEAPWVSGKGAKGKAKGGGKGKRKGGGGKYQRQW